MKLLGKKIVSINGGQKIYYSNATTENGFETGGTTNFLYYSAKKSS